MLFWDVKVGSKVKVLKGPQAAGRPTGTITRKTDMSGEFNSISVSLPWKRTGYFTEKEVNEGWVELIKE